MDTRFVVASALAAAIAAPALLLAQGPAPTPSFKAEKCYGIAKAGKNDCASTGNNSCAGTSKVKRGSARVDLRARRLLRSHRQRQPEAQGVTR